MSFALMGKRFLETGLFAFAQWVNGLGLGEGRWLLKWTSEWGFGYGALAIILVGGDTNRGGCVCGEHGDDSEPTEELKDRDREIVGEVCGHAVPEGIVFAP